MSGEKRRNRITRRAENRCEYCHLHQDCEPFLLFHIEHIYARQHIEDDSDGNLCLACSHCNFHKGPNLSGIDPDSVNLIVELFHPRNDNWNDHFEWEDAKLFGKTPTGRATIHVLAVNSSARIELREELLKEGFVFS